MVYGIRFATISAAAALMIGAGVKSAQGATIEPDDFAADTNITNSTPGVTLSAFGAFYSSKKNVFARAPSGVGTNGGASTGNLVFGFNDSYGVPGFISPGKFTSVTDGGKFTAMFTTPVNTVSLDFLSNGSTPSGPGLDSSSATFTAFDSGGNELDQAIATSIPGGTFQTLTVTSPTDIASVVASAPQSGNTTSQQGVNLDHLVFNTGVVPEPASLALLGAGGLMMLSRRQRRQAA